MRVPHLGDSGLPVAVPQTVRNPRSFSLKSAVTRHLDPCIVFDSHFQGWLVLTDHLSFSVCADHHFSEISIEEVVHFTFFFDSLVVPSQLGCRASIVSYFLHIRQVLAERDIVAVTSRSLVRLAG